MKAWTEVTVKVLVEPPEAFGADGDYKASWCLVFHSHGPSLVLSEMFAADQLEVGRELCAPRADLPLTAWDRAH